MLQPSNLKSVIMNNIDHNLLDPSCICKVNGNCDSNRKNSLKSSLLIETFSKFTVSCSGFIILSFGVIGGSIGAPVGTLTNIHLIGGFFGVLLGMGVPSSSLVGALGGFSGGFTGSYLGSLITLNLGLIYGLFLSLLAGGLIGGVSSLIICLAVLQ